MSEKKTAVVDGANVAFVEQTVEGKPKVSNVTAVCAELEKRGFTPIVIVDAALRHKVDDPEQLEALITKKVIRQAPAGTDADFFVVKTAEEYDAIIVSNDRLEPYREDHPWIEERRVPLMIIRGDVQLYEEKIDGGD